MKRIMLILLYEVLAMDCSALNSAIIPLSNTFELNKYYESVFCALETQTLQRISEVLTALKVDGWKNSRRQNLSGNILLTQFIGILLILASELIKSFRHVSSKGFRYMVFQAKALKNSDLEILEQMLRIREYEEKYEKGNLG